MRASVAVAVAVLALALSSAIRQSPSSSATSGCPALTSWFWATLTPVTLAESLAEIVAISAPT